MFNRNDFKEIDGRYFDVMQTTLYHVILRSKNTGHYWDIENSDLNNRSLIINHKHALRDQWHQQRKCHPATLFQAQQIIKRHDDWFLKANRHPPR